MCGISGIIGHNISPETIDRMVAAQSHRGPDAHGVYISPDFKVALGHNRLSILDLSSLAHQPMTDDSGMLHLVFNGEIYNYRELKKELSTYPYRTQTDSEVILAAYQKWGFECLEHFIGMFSFALWDEKEKTLFCARDRLGIKPFHYHVSENGFYFSSEIKALLSAGIQAAPDWETWGTYFKHGIYDHDTKTFFKDIRVLPSGHKLILKDEDISITPYWDIPQKAATLSTLSFSQACDEFEHLMIDSVRLRLRSDVPVGVNLSGGLDSSSLFSFVDAQSETTDQLNYFTYAFDDPQYDEVDFADQVPRRKAWSKHVTRLSPEILWESVLPLMWHEESPYGGTGTIAYYHMHRTIRETGTIVVLEGQGVDELLAGYAYYQKPVTSEALYQDGTSFLRPQSIHPDILRYAPEHLEFDKPFKSDLNNRLYQDIRHTKLPRVLRMNDRLSMAFGIELREPFLDHRVVEFCFSQPDDYKIQNGVSKFLLREVMKKYLPPQIRETPKRPVVTPQREWIKGALKNKIQDMLRSKEFLELGIFDPSICLNMVDDFCHGNNDNAFFIWQWINYAAWDHVFIKNRSWASSTL